MAIKRYDSLTGEVLNEGSLGLECQDRADTARADIARGMAAEDLQDRDANRATALYAQNKRRNHFIWHLFFPSSASLRSHHSQARTTRMQP